MPRQAFEQQLVALHEATVIMGEQVQTAVEQAIHAFAARDQALGRKVVEEDAGINRMESQILERAELLVTLQAPVASDLRRILGITRVAGNLERIGDHARDIGRVAQRVSSVPAIEDLIDLPALIEEVARMVRDGLRAFGEGNLELARAVAEQDDQVDRSYSSLFQELLGHMMADTSTITRATYTLLVARDLERIADRITNISESTIYIVTGKVEELN